jgi:hypothetical protein
MGPIKEPSACRDVRRRGQRRSAGRTLEATRLTKAVNAIWQSLELLCRIRNDAAALAHRDPTFRMFALRCIENRPGKLDIYGASQDALDRLADTVAPQLHPVWKLLRWSRGGLPLSDVVAGLLHELERKVAELGSQCCGGFERETILFLWRSVT